MLKKLHLNLKFKTTTNPPICLIEGNPSAEHYKSNVLKPQKEPMAQLKPKLANVARKYVVQMW